MTDAIDHIGSDAPQDNYRPRTRTTPAERWASNVHDIAADLSRYIKYLNVFGVPPNRTVLETPVDKDENGDERKINKENLGPGAEAHLYAHATVFELRDQFVGVTQQHGSLTELWDETLLEVDVEDGYQVKQNDHSPAPSPSDTGVEFIARPPPKSFDPLTQTRPVCLATLKDKWMFETVFRRNVKRNVVTGSKASDEPYKLLLPPVAISACDAQLRRLMSRAGLDVDIDERSYAVFD